MEEVLKDESMKDLVAHGPNGRRLYVQRSIRQLPKPRQHRSAIPESLRVELSIIVGIASSWRTDVTHGVTISTPSEVRRSIHV